MRRAWRWFGVLAWLAAWFLVLGGYLAELPFPMALGALFLVLERLDSIRDALRQQSKQVNVHVVSTGQDEARQAVKRASFRNGS